MGIKANFYGKVADDMSIEKIIEDWVEEAGLHKFLTSAIVVHTDEIEINIATNRPGLMIGYHGSLIYKYKEILKDNGFIQNVRLSEIRPRSVLFI